MPDAGQRTTLQEYVISECRDKDQNQGLEAVVMAIAEGSRRVQQQVQQAALADVLGVTGETNVQGEIVQRLDAASSDIFVETLSRSGHVAAIGCEEIEKPVIVEGEVADGFIVLMDPLDGSSNIDVAVSIGSIFGIWKKRPGEMVNDDSLLRPGNEQVAAAYVVYGSSTVLVLATKNLLKGGIFAYPADKNRKDGRLRLMYEANPLGFVAEQAGGAASTGYKRILDIVPEQLHQRTPLILGNKDVVEETVSVISGG